MTRHFPSNSPGTAIQQNEIAPDEIDQALDLSAIVGFLRRQIWVMLATAIAVMIVVAVVVLQLTPRYTAEVLLQIDAAAQRLTDAETSTAAVTTSTSFVAGQVDIIRSDSVIRRTVRDLGLVERPELQRQPSIVRQIRQAVLGGDDLPPSLQDAESRTVNALRRQMNVSRLGQTFNIRVEYTSTDPEFAALVANGLVQSYIDLQVEKKAATARHASTALAQRVEDVAANLVNVENQIGAFLSANLGGREDVSADEIQRINAEILQLAREREALASTLAATRSGLGSDDVATVATSLGSLSLSANAPPEVIDLSAELSRIVEQRAQASEADSQRLVEEANLLASNAEEALVARLETIRGEEEMARARLAALLGDQSGEAGVQLFRLQSEAESAREIYRVALDLLKRAQIGSDVQVPDARIVSDATAPIDPSFPPTNLFLALAGISGLGIGAGFGLLREFFFTGFVSAAQIERALQLPVVSTVPYSAPGTIPTQDIVVHRPLSPFAEALRRWRLTIDAAARPGEPLTVLVTSAVPGEGKSTMALALARLYAKSGKRTVIIDCDLRRPTLAKLASLDVDTQVKVGVFEFLKRELGQASAKDIVQRDPLTEVDLIVGKPSGGQATDYLLSSPAFAELIVLLRKHYDVVIMDSPPLVPVVDGRILMRQADVVTQILKWGETSPANAIAVAREISQPGSPPACVVLNQSRGGESGYSSYRYQYGYGE